MQFTEERNVPWLLLLIDFAKAFDSVSWQFIDKALNYFNLASEEIACNSNLIDEMIGVIKEFLRNR